MLEEPQVIIDRIALLIQGTVMQALQNYRIDKTL
jgi:hypothetical protein